MVQYKTPGVYVREESNLSPSVVGVSTAIPAFIGVVAKGNETADPFKISSLLDYQTKFGGYVDVDFGGGSNNVVTTDTTSAQSYDPIVSENGTWMVFDADAQEYKETTCPVADEQGNDVNAPMIGEDGYWCVWDIQAEEYVTTQILGKKPAEPAASAAPAEPAACGSIPDNKYTMYDSIRLFYLNGGSDCYIVPLEKEASDEDYLKAIKSLEDIDEVTLLVLPDVNSVQPDMALTIQAEALAHCEKMKDRFAILSVKCTGDLDSDMSTFRGGIGMKGLCYGAAYYPYVKTSWKRDIAFDDVIKTMSNYEDIASQFSDEVVKQSFLKDQTNQADALIAYEKVKKDVRKAYINAHLSEVKGYEEQLAKIQESLSKVPPCGAIAGIYSYVDANKGVWQAPANISISGVSGATMFISDDKQEKMNVHDSGKSINAIRFFSGKGVLVWGARTLDALGSEWRYIPVRRLFNYVEESIQESTAWAVFQPNDSNTWVRIKCQIENFLSNLWSEGAFAGATPDQAFFVQVGLGISMTTQDILDGYLKVNIGLAAVRPAEFIVLTFSHKLQES